jgi:hypothetical protein
MLRGSGFVNVNQEPERMCADNTNAASGGVLRYAPP